MTRLKTIMLTAAMLGLALPAMAESSNSQALFDRYAQTDGYTLITVGPGLFNFAAMFGDELKPLEQIDQVKVLHAKTQATSKTLSGAVAQLLDNNQYVELVDIVETGKKTTVYGIKNGQALTEILMVSNADQATVISVRGTLDKQTLDRIKEIARKAHCNDKTGHHGA